MTAANAAPSDVVAFISNQTRGSNRGPGTLDALAENQRSNFRTSSSYAAADCRRAAISYSIGLM